MNRLSLLSYFSSHNKKRDHRASTATQIVEEIGLFCNLRRRNQLTKKEALHISVILSNFRRNLTLMPSSL